MFHSPELNFEKSDAGPGVNNRFMLTGTQDEENRSVILTSPSTCQTHSQENTARAAQTNSIPSLYGYGISKVTKEIAKISIAKN